VSLGAAVGGPTVPGGPVVLGPAVLGLDVGTESARAGLFSLDGSLLAEGRAGYPTVFPEPGWAEQDPVTVWDAVTEALRACLDSAAGVTPVACSLSATAVSAVTIDAEGVPSGPALLWMDTRATAEAEEITATGRRGCRYSRG
jgi:sugar (pentulose or hexulose) kinase